MGGLRCPFERCHHVVRAMTGLQEIDKLILHYARKHRVRMTMTEALEERVRIENSGVYTRKET